MSTAVVPSGQDYNLRILRPLACYLTEKKGAPALHGAATAAGVPPEYLDGRSHWIATAQFEAFLSKARSLLDNDEEFQRACCYKMADSYGPMRFILRAASPGLVFRQSLNTYHLVCHVGAHEVLSSTRTSMVARFTASPAPHRLVCLCKSAQVTAMPTLWGLPPASLIEESCVGLGDPQCLWRLRWFDGVRWGPTILGAAIAAVGTLFLARSGVMPVSTAWALTGIAGLLTHIRELYSTATANRAVEKEMTKALEDLVAHEIESRNELLELHRSQAQWSRLLESEARDRASEIQQLAAHFEQLEASRSQLFRGYSHDLRNPLQVLRLATGYLRIQGTDEKSRQVLDEIDWSVAQMNQLLTDLNRIIAQPAGVRQLAPQELQVADLSERIRRRVRALAHGKGVRTTVFATREAPSKVHVDPIVFDRIVDNLLTNAVKYTERGSIVIELDGEVGWLVLKISDTGRGIAQDDLVRTFKPGGSDEASRASGSLGVGLSVVVQLLGQIAGRLEVMSKPSVGTTFWVRFPVESQAVSDSARDANEPYSHIFERVVSIRRVTN